MALKVAEVGGSAARAVDPAVAAPARRAPMVAVDAMGGDRAPAEVVAGALLSAEAGISVLLVGQEPVVAPLLDGLDSRALAASVDFLHAGEVVAMDDDPAKSVRRKKDSSLVRCAEAVRDGRADAMVSAGNTGATMASALLRMGRIRGIARPAIVTPIPGPLPTPTLLLDVGATVDCAPEWLVQFARMGAEYARLHHGIERARIGLLSIGEEMGKGDEMRKRTYDLLSKEPGFIGNVEGSDLTLGRADVVVTDGFTGNVALKTLEGGMRTVLRLAAEALGLPVGDSRVGEVLEPVLGPAVAQYDPDAFGGAVLLGIDGVCVISHGASNARNIDTAIRLAAECAEAGIVHRMKEAISHHGV
ncbi:MAG: phosphate acyltransferase [Actinomycetota bacterium]|nr:phosphate acyltransferase [Actinomycetota bacterium]MDQ1505565.1 phosphate acyltransferase [Actinomycetota bacterium]